MEKYEEVKVLRSEKYQDLQSALIKNGNLQDEAIILQQVLEEKESVGYLATVRHLSARHLMIVLSVFTLSHLSGISIVTAYLVDIFEDSSAIDPLVLLIVSSPWDHINLPSRQCL